MSDEHNPNPELKKPTGYPLVFPTASHKAVFIELWRYGCGYFYPPCLGRIRATPLKTRFNRLISGPTGVGKSHLAQMLANCFGANFVEVNFGDWVPIGARNDPNTLTRLAVALLRSKKVVLLIDELDKVVASGRECSWSISCLNEIYAVLERRISVDDVLSAVHARTPDIKIDEPEKKRIIEEALQHNLFIIACGTWQAARRAFAKPSKTPLGFTMEEEAEELVAAFCTRETVEQNQLIPDELRCRFHAKILELRNPTKEEVWSLAKAWNLVELAEQVEGGIEKLKNFDVSNGGIREIESFYTDLLTSRMDLPPLEQMLVKKPFERRRFVIESTDNDEDLSFDF